MSEPGQSRQSNQVRFTLEGVRFSLFSMFLFSLVGGGINALGAIFVIQIYDRVLPSHSVPTLIVLAFLFLSFYIFHGALAAIIGRLSDRTGLMLLAAHEPTFLRLTQALRRSGIPRLEAGVPLEDFRTVVAAIRGRLLTSLFDLVWTPILIVVLCFVSVYMAAFAVSLITVQCLASYVASGRAFDEGSRHRELWRTSLARETTLFAPPSRLARLVSQDLERERVATLLFRSRERDLKGFATAVKEIGHSGILVVGAWLVLTDAMSIGAMMASGMLMMRILAPVQAVLRDKEPVHRALQSWKRLKAYDLGRTDKGAASNSGNPVHALTVFNLSLLPPKSEIKACHATFSLSSGQCLVVAGPSGSGKTLLLKRLCGIVGSRPGAIRLGDEMLQSINDERLSRLIGYVPQDHVFTSGTLMEIIGKFSPEFSRDDAICTAKRLGIHHAIMQLDEGYETVIAPGEVPLPYNLLRQIAFARALVDGPSVLILDDPFRGLSTDTGRRLAEILAERKAEGSILVIAMPELAVTELADFAMVLGNQKVLAFGSVSEVLALPPSRLMGRDFLGARHGGTSA